MLNPFVEHYYANLFPWETVWDKCFHPTKCTREFGVTCDGVMKRHIHLSDSDQLKELVCRQQEEFDIHFGAEYDEGQEWRGREFVIDMEPQSHVIHKSWWRDAWSDTEETGCVCAAKTFPVCMTCIGRMVRLTRMLCRILKERWFVRRQVVLYSGGRSIHVIVSDEHVRKWTSAARRTAICTLKSQVDELVPMTESFSDALIDEPVSIGHNHLMRLPMSVRFPSMRIGFPLTNLFDDKDPCIRRLLDAQTVHELPTVTSIVEEYGSDADAFVHDFPLDHVSF